MKFNEFKLDEQLLEAIDYMGFDEATPIQEKAIPEILNDKDLLACAQTGTGKTAAFLLPIMEKLAKEENTHHTDTLIIVPTRELAIQIDQQIQGMGYFADIESAPIFGGGDGDDFSTQRRALEKGTRIIVATPGKMIQHLNMGYVNFKDVRHLVLDEADRMLDIGFYEDIMKIISHVAKKRQTLLFSATMPPKIRTLASKILNNPVEINLALSKPAEGVLQAAYLVYENQKTPLIQSLLKDKDEEYDRILIFSSTKKKVHDIVQAFKRKKYNVAAISSDLDQDQRNEVLLDFRSKKLRILVATDVLSRGIDIKDIDLVINYDVPGDAEDYVHRIGRTARAKSTGVALTLINEDDMIKFHRIEKLIENEVLKLPLPPEIGESPEWRLNHPVKRRFRGGRKKR